MASANNPQAEVRAGGRGLAVWSVHHPVGVSMIALALVVLGAFALGRLGIDLLPHLIYPDIRVRIVDPGVPPTVMEDQVTRQLEEQLAITEGAIRVQSTTREGRSAVDLSFGYGRDIDQALQDASSRLDRAKRFLPDTIEPPIIYKRDPAQIPVAEFVVASPLRSPVELRTWVDYIFAKWFLNLPGVAAAEVGGGLVREIQVLPDQQRLAGMELDLLDLIQALEEGNVDTPGGRLLMPRGEIGSRTAGRFATIDEISALPLRPGETDGLRGAIRLGELARVLDTHEEERLRVRLNGVPGIKLSIQKQPQANTVAVVDAVHQRLAWLVQQKLLPQDIEVRPVSDQAVYVRNALRNAATAAGSGALLAMAVVYLFLGNLRRTLLIGSAIPIAIMVTFVLMAMGGLTLNIMTLGGLALGIGMLVDSTIVMLENITRHQRGSDHPELAPVTAAGEVNSAIVASTSTNLAAVLPFLFAGGLVGLLFRELIFTISAAIVAAMLVALTVVPAIAGRIHDGGQGRWRARINNAIERAQSGYARFIAVLLKHAWWIVAAFLATLVLAVPRLVSNTDVFLPPMDEGRVSVGITVDTGGNLDELDEVITRLETLFLQQPEVESVFSQVGGFIFGRSEYEAANRARINIQLKPVTQRTLSTNDWIQGIQKQISAMRMAGVKVRMRSRGIRGVRTSLGDDDVSIRIKGPDLEVLADLGAQVVARIQPLRGMRNVLHSLEEQRQEVAVVIDRERAMGAGLSARGIGNAVRIALQGMVVTDFIDGDQVFDLRLRLPRPEITSPRDLESIVLFGNDGSPVYLGDVATVELTPTPANIQRDGQQRIVEISASLTGDVAIGDVLASIQSAVADLKLPAGYTLYDGGSAELLQSSQTLGQILLALALFLVFVVMAVQYESLRNPLVIIISVPFAGIGVALGILVLDLPISMPVWLGMIMLAGIVVNNAIVLVEYIEIRRRAGLAVGEAIIDAARLRLRPILMTTLTTVAGMAPLALGLGEGAEMLQPLAITIVWGLSFSMLVSLVLVPVVYQLLRTKQLQPAMGTARLN